MPMRMRFTLLFVAAAMVVGLAAPFAVAAKRPAQGGTMTVSAVTGTFTDALHATGHFAGTFSPTSAKVINGRTNIVGNLSGTLTNSVGAPVGSVSQSVALPVTDPPSSCQILNLTLGPLDLNLLGLVVHLDTVHLTITAVPGPGNLLGNLLCAVAGLLDNNNLGNALAALLNQIIGILNGL
jgi:hypothetical protein